MAIVSSVPVPRESLLERFHRHDFSSTIPSSLTGNGGGGVEVEEKVFVALGKDAKDAKSTLLWALHHSAGKKICILHVHQPAQTIPFLGGKFPPNKLKEQVVTAYRDLEKQNMHKMLNEYLFICAQLGVRAEKLYIEMESIEKGIVELVASHGIKRLIMGTTISKQRRTTTLKSKKAIFVNQEADVSCHIWFVSKGCLIQSREGTSDELERGICESPFANPISEASQAFRLRSASISEEQSGHGRFASPVQKFIRRVRSHGRKVATVASLDGMSGMSTPKRQLNAEENVTESEQISGGTPSQGSAISSWFSSEGISPSSQSISLMRGEGSEDGSLLLSVQESEEAVGHSSPMTELDGRTDHGTFDQLRHAMEEVESSKISAVEELVKRQKAEKDAIDAISKAKESENLYANEVKQRKEMEVQLASDSLERDKIRSQNDEVMEKLTIALDQKMELENQVAESNRKLQELEDKIVSAVELLVSFKQQRDQLQLERDSALKEAEQLRERRKEGATSSQTQQFISEFSFSEIDAATRNFDQSLVIGEGGYGSVYKGFLRNTDVAIKLLNSSSSQGRSEFQQEVDVLSRMRHPNLLTLIGTCPEAWSLIYEYLPNGNLEDRLACKDNTLPLSWQTRVRIAVEICSALIFLHCNKPHGIIHGDLKPSNILLDANFISKLGDFGICRSLTGDETLNDSTTLCCKTENPKGTLVYMDPEFLSTGELTPKSDVYSFGIILLQLLTGRRALGIWKEVKCALDGGILNEVLDSSAGDWPFVQAKQLAHLALRCSELNRESRPDLITEVWRVLEPMKAACGAMSSFSLGSEKNCQAPSYFICPIFQEIMSDPRIAADGFTYEAEAINGWLESGHNTSPMTNLKLAHTELIPNHALRSAIEEWRQQQ